MPESPRPRVLVIGGGLAGMAAACSLCRDFDVTLLEKRPFLGGRVYSLEDAATGCEVENAQHVFLGVCERFLAFARMLGLEKSMALPRGLDLRLRDGKKWRRLRSLPLPSPLHLLPAFFALRALSWKERLGVARAMRRIARMDGAGKRKWEGKTFAGWLAAEGQGPAARRWFWDLFCLPALNAPPEECDAGLAFLVFRLGLLESSSGAAVGYFRAGQGLMGREAARYVKAHGGKVLTGRAAAELRVERNRVLGVLDSTGEEHRAEAFVAALPPEALYRLVPPSLRNIPPFVNLPKIQGSPIVGAHMWFDREFLDFEHAGFPGHPVQWIFNKNRIFGPPPAGGQYLSIILSAARRECAMPKDELLREMDAHLRALFPAASGAKLLHGRVVKEPFATFLPTTECERLRPPARTGIPNLFLAGEWTDTGWPSTMEGAVRSGETAAALVRETPAA
jgi:squalene-associated FAD-dependent desaturase